MYEISVYHNFLGVPFKSLGGREVQASQTGLCIQITHELWPPESMSGPHCGEPDVTGLTWLGSDIFNMFHK